MLEKMKKVNNILFLILPISYILISFVLGSNSTEILVCTAFFLIIEILSILNFEKKSDTKYSLLVFITNTISILLLCSVLIRYILCKNFDLFVSAFYIRNKLEIILLTLTTFLTFLYTCIKKHECSLFNKQFIKDLMFIFINLIFIFINLFIALVSESFILILLAVGFSIFYIHKLLKKETLLYSNKYNIALLILNFVSVYRILLDINIYTIFNWLSVVYWILIFYFCILILHHIRKLKVKKILTILFYIIYFLCLVITIIFDAKAQINAYKEQQQVLEVWKNEMDNIKKKNKYSLYEPKGDFEFYYDNEFSTMEELNNFVYTAANSGFDRMPFINKTGNEIHSIDVPIDLINNHLPTYYQIKHTIWTFKPMNDKIYDYIEYVSFEKYYSEDEIKYVEEIIEKLYTKLYNPNLVKEENIRIFHDCIINAVKYDKKENRTTARDVFEKGIASSRGYADTMALLLDKMNISNIKINSDNHVWNLVNLNGKWYHLDVAWDDSDNSLSNTNDNYKYFLIDDSTLSSYNSEFHNYDRNAYKF